MSHYLTAIRQAQDTHTRRGFLSAQQRVDAAHELAEWGVFSARNIAQFTGLRPGYVAELIGKRDRTGGQVTPDALPYLAELIHLRETGKTDVFAAKRALDAGCSSGMAARLTGIPQSTLSRWVRKAAA